MMNARHPISAWRAFIKNKRLIPFTIRDASLESIICLPRFLNVFCNFSKMQLFIFRIFLLHFLFFSVNLKKDAKVKIFRRRIRGAAFEKYLKCAKLKLILFVKINRFLMDLNCLVFGMALALYLIL